tara:strand:+ start:77 stop:226 length:150 start_codon:yes stop_codon:yes gene_type:complete
MKTFLYILLTATAGFTFNIIALTVGGYVVLAVTVGSIAYCILAPSKKSK